MVDVAAGVVEMYLSSFASAFPFLEAGKVKALGLSSPTVPDFVRTMPFAKDLQPIADQGVPGFDLELWYGIFGPARTPRHVVEFLEKEIAEVLRLQSVQETLIKIAIEPKFMNSEKFSAYVRSEAELWKSLAQDRKPPK